MKVKEVIESLQRSLERGEFREDDELHTTWWSYEDVRESSGTLSDDEARVVWAKVYDEVSGWDEGAFDNELIYAEIQSALGNEDGDKN